VNEVDLKLTIEGRTLAIPGALSTTSVSALLDCSPRRHRAGPRRHLLSGFCRATRRRKPPVDEPHVVLSQHKPSDSVRTWLRLPRDDLGSTGAVDRGAFW